MKVDHEERTRLNGGLQPRGVLLPPIWPVPRRRVVPITARVTAHFETNNIARLQAGEKTLRIYILYVPTVHVRGFRRESFDHDLACQSAIGAFMPRDMFTKDLYARRSAQVTPMIR